VLDTAGAIFHSGSNFSIETQIRLQEDSTRRELNRISELNRLSHPTGSSSSENPDNENSIEESNIPLPESPLTELTTESEHEEMTGENDENTQRKPEKSLPAASSNDAPDKGADEDDIAEFLEQFEDVVDKYQPSL
jgi:hypothetical protein